MARYFSGGGVPGQNIVYYSTNPYGSRYFTSTPNTPKSVLPFSDAWSYLSWAAVRPPTEMEWEKAGRDINGDTRRFPWGDTQPDTVTYTPPNEGGTFARKYLNYDYSVSGTGRVLDAGRYLSGDVYRSPEETGASPWGIADLAGNLAEYIFNCSYPAVPSNGTGTVSWPSDWASNWGDAVNIYTGFRGGSWINDATYVSGWYLSISGRGWAAYNTNAYYTDTGARAVRGP